MQHVPWRTLYAEAGLAGSTSLDGRTVYKLTLTPRPWLDVSADGREAATADGAPVDASAGKAAPDVWFVDAESFELVRWDALVKTPIGEQVGKMHFSDYRAVDGVRYAHERSAEMAGMTIEVTVDEIRHDVELPPNTFQLPETVQKALSAATDETDAGGLETRIDRVEEQHAAVVRIRCNAADISQQMSIALPEVMMHLTSIGAEIAGPPFSRYYSVGAEMDFECGIPVAEPIEPTGRIELVTLPGGHVVTAWHVGPYHELGASHETMQAWMAEREIRSAGPLWEVYWTDPGLEPDPAKWRTQLFVPCERP
jgi:effector-binding domain-containing protein